MKSKILSFFKIIAYVLGLIGGLGWTIYSKGYVIAICVAVLGLMAFPEFKNSIKKILE